MTETNQATTYQCPNCGAPLHFSPTDGQVHCDYCDSTFSVEVIEKLQADKARGQKDLEAHWQEAAPGTAWQEGEDAAFSVYRCPSCGAEIICDDNTVATTCVYCGNPTVLSGRLSGTLKPDYIVPFAMTKDDAVQALKNYYRGKRLLPRAFTDQNHIEEIKAVYVPFWLFDATVDADMVFDATRTNVYVLGPNEVTETKHYRVARKGEMTFLRVPVDGSTKMPDEYMDAIEPFDYDRMVPFASSYLPGFLAEKYDVTAEESMQRASDRMNKTAMRLVQETVNYETATVTASDISFKDKQASYALLPVWMLSTRYRGQNYLFAMNGQTGRLIGDLPVSKWQALKWFGIVTVPTFAALTLLLALL
jgi:DNA-directed RNA polymerase subunit RPC12/RpoP